MSLTVSSSQFAAKTEPAREHKARGFAFTFAFAAIACFIALTAVSVWRDPYWVFRNNPAWLLQTGGANRLIDLEMRRAKPLRYASLKPAIVLVGSSTTYRGLDPADIESAAGSRFNLGISALVAAELPVIAELIAGVPETRHVVIGLDYFMFTNFRAPPAVRPAVATAWSRTGEYFAAAVNTGALMGLSSHYLARAEPGAWRANGFKTTPDFAPLVATRVDAAQDVTTMVNRPTALADLAKTLAILKGREVKIYLSPLSKAQLARIGERGNLQGLARWRRDVAALASFHQAQLTDLVDLAHQQGLDDFDPAKGSSANWIDNLHYKPHVGKLVIDQVNITKAAVR
jgi:hypothetical protein